MPKSTTTVTFLGGLSDIGRNCAALEAEGKTLILDCGVLFANETQPGVDNILPDMNYLYDRADSIVGCVLTHAHEDHIGALRHLLKEVDCPLYGSPFTLGLASRRIIENGIEPELIEVKTGETVKIGPFECEFLHVTHSVPGGHITVINTPQGKILHSSDFKLDETPLDNKFTDLNRIKEISATDGIRLLLADSTNADSEGISDSESSIQEGIQKVFNENKGRRIFVACFSSHIHRIQQIVNVAKKENRKIAIMGLSMLLNIDLARSLGVLELDDYLGIEDIDGIPDEKLCIISTGSQAEENSALAKASNGTSRWVNIGENDTIVLSSNPIPGNEARVYRMMNDFTAQGAEIASGSNLGLHTTGHGKRGELKVLHNAANPEWFTPVHGEYRHLKAHKELAMSLGMAEEKVLLSLDGDQIEMTDEGLKLHYEVSSGEYLFSQGDFVSFDDSAIIERRNLSQHGMIQVVVNKNSKSVYVDSKGLLDSEMKEEIHNRVANRVKRSLDGTQKPKKEEKFSKRNKKAKNKKKSGQSELGNLKKQIKKAVRQEVKESLGRFPLILIYIV